MCLRVKYICPACPQADGQNRVGEYKVHLCPCVGLAKTWPGSKCKDKKTVAVPTDACDKDGCLLNPKVREAREREVEELRRKIGDLKPDPTDDELEDGMVMMEETIYPSSE
ncbi:hypothetical protein QBC34DRAFT_437324 [Podospora aff. communis PSN243]|uniref:Uncharacterized protein n=1 Tax=Podospora aff. communis PSN243 TaxID=3040156 RepID=A0AAV9GQ12_9PEZI|nr:hypothetical protein QBC34DRAFT_437324 [Podospora aff. communis PSN243]